MAQFIDFVHHHPLLFVAFGVVVLLLIANELFSLMRGGKSIGPGEAVRLINDKDAVVLDVRSESEYRKNHILNARHVPRQRLEEDSKEMRQLKDHELIVYAATDTASAQVRDKLSAKGYATVYSLRGGIHAWQSASLPVSKK